MALHAGSHGHSAGSLSAAIERAFAAEVMGAKLAQLPAAGKEDRAMLFNAIAQGVLAYLRVHEDDLQIALSGLPSGATARVRIMSPTLAWVGTSVVGGSRSVHVTGDRWPAGDSVRLTWDGEPAPVATVLPSGSAGGIDRWATVPAAATSPIRLAARNDRGDAVVVEVTW
jgi:hypothetical protein